MRAIAIFILIFTIGCAKTIENNDKATKVVITDQKVDSKTLSLIKKSELQTQLKQAIETSSVNLVRSAIYRGASPDSIIIGNETALTYAIKNHQNSILSILVGAGANTNLHNYYNESPLHVAIENNDTILTRILLSKKATNINDVNRNGESALIRALRQKNKRISLMLISEDADLEIRSEVGDIIEDVAYNNFDEKFATFIERLRKFNNQVTRVETLKKITKEKDVFTLRYIKIINQKKDMTFSTIFLRDSVNQPDLIVAKQLINTLFAISKIPVYTQYMMLIEAIKLKNLELIKMLYSKMTLKKPNFYDNSDRTLLSYAVESRSYQSTLFLRKKGADTYFETPSKKIINSCRYLNKRRFTRRAYKNFENILGC